MSHDKELPKSCTSYDNKGIQRKMKKNLIKDYIEIIQTSFGKEKILRHNFSQSLVDKVFPIKAPLLTGYIELP